MRSWCEPVFRITADAFTAFISAPVAEGAVGASAPAIDDWHRAMLLPIPNTVKYAKAVSRITSQQPNIYTSAAYNDFNTTCIALNVLNLGSAEGAYSGSTSPEWREEFWLLLHTLNTMAAGAVSYKMPEIPSRVQIRDNIDTHRRESVLPAEPPQTVTVAGAFGIAMQAFAQAMPTPALSVYINSQAGAGCVTLASWGSMITPAFEDAAHDSNHRFMSSFGWPLFPPEVAAEVCAAFVTVPNPILFVNINQMNGFARVATHIPSNVMGQIEGYTAKLLRDVRSGAVNIRNLDLQKIGSEVLSNVSARDMSALNANIEGLIPILENTSFRS